MRRITGRPRGSLLAGAGLACALLSMAVAGRADPVATCIGANERSLDLRKQGKLIDARRELAVCAASTCPDVIQRACATRIAEINGAIPSLVLDVKDATGRTPAGARVSIDGKPSAPIGVTAIAIDPGTHTLRFEVDGQAPVEKTVAVLEGEKEKRVGVAVGQPIGGGPEVKHLARLVVSSDEAATIVIDGHDAARGKLDAELSVGPHDVQVTELGKVSYKAQLDLRDGEMRSLSVALEDESHGAPVWPWIAGGVAVAAGAALGGYFLFKPQDTTTVGIPAGKTASVTLSLTGR